MGRCSHPVAQFFLLGARPGRPLRGGGSEQGPLGVTEGPGVASSPIQGWSSFATGASKFASAAKEGVSRRSL